MRLNIKSLKQLNEAELIIQLKKEQQSAYYALVELFSSKVYNTCLSMLQNEDDARDTVQEVFIEIYRSVKSFKGDSALSTWIYRVATNKCLDVIRKKNTKKYGGKLIRLDGEEPYPLLQPSDFNHPGIQMEQKEKARMLFAAMERLPENQRAAFTLFHVEGFTYKEIAEIMKMNLPGIESLMHRAKTNLKKMLNDFYNK
ncbi:MAG: RNA polymerase sigma factor [Bacteroidia bacterium]